MYYVYILKHPAEDRIYIGFSADLRGRMRRHESEHSRWRLAYYEAYASEGDARARERRLKKKGKEQKKLKKRNMGKFKGGCKKGGGVGGRWGSGKGKGRVWENGR